MKKYTILLFSLLLVGCQEPENPDNPDVVPQNGIEISDQIWMKKNLELTEFRNGEEIFHARNQEEWNQAYFDKIPAWSFYENLEENGKVYGLMYNYYAIKDSRNLAPEGWKIPSISDWNRLYENNGGKAVAGKKLKSQNYWISKTGTNESGFDALPGGDRFLGGYFNDIGIVASFWTTSLDSEGNIITTGIGDGTEDSRVFESLTYPEYFKPGGDLHGFYVRCIKE